MKQYRMISQRLKEFGVQVTDLERWKWACKPGAAGGNNLHKIDSIKTLQKALDSINQIQLSQIIEKNGWPAKSTTGYNIASMAPYLVIKHIENVDIQKKFLPVIIQSIKIGKEDGDDYADLVDRILIKEGKKQRYGTQYTRNKETNKLELYPLENKKNIDEIRTEIGLMPLVDYLEMNGIEYENY